MTRCVTVYALNNTEDVAKAFQALSSIKALLPAEVRMSVYTTGSADEKEVQIPSWVFGDFAQVLDFDDQGEYAFTYDDFLKSEAWAELKRRTKGFFSNEVTTRYHYE